MDLNAVEFTLFFLLGENKQAKTVSANLSLRSAETSQTVKEKRRLGQSTNQPKNFDVYSFKPRVLAFPCCPVENSDWCEIVLVTKFDNVMPSRGSEGLRRSLVRERLRTTLVMATNCTAGEFSYPPKIADLFHSFAHLNFDFHNVSSVFVPTLLDYQQV